jgi:hypothetical protein
MAPGVFPSWCGTGEPPADGRGSRARGEICVPAREAPSLAREVQVVAVANGIRDWARAEKLRDSRPPISLPAMSEKARAFPPGEVWVMPVFSKADNMSALKVVELRGLWMGMELHAHGGAGDQALADADHHLDLVAEGNRS